METLQPFIDSALSLAREGFTQVNAVLGLIIAAVAAFLMKKYTQILVIGIGATVAHILIKRLIPVVSGDGAFQLPPLLDGTWWRSAAAVFIGYLVVITVLYILRRTLLKGGH